MGAGENSLRSMSYAGKLSHPDFGPEKVDIQVHLHSADAGQWLVLGRREDFSVERGSNGRISFHQRSGPTVLDGAVDGDGAICGEVVQRGSRGGAFVLKPAVGGQAAPDSPTAPRVSAESPRTEKDRPLQELQDTYWQTPKRSLVAFRHQADAEPEEVTRQAIWWIQRVEQRFLFGYAWEMLSDAEDMRVRRLAVSVAPDGAARACYYGDPRAPTVCNGRFDGKKFTLHVVDGDLIGWNQMVRVSNFERPLPGCEVSLQQLRRVLPVPHAGNISDPQGWKWPSWLGGRLCSLWCSAGQGVGEPV